MVTEKERQETPEEAQETSEVTQGAEMSQEKRKIAAQKIVRNRTLAAAGVALLPFPVVDLIAVTGIQVETVKRLADLYDLEFKNDLTKSIITSLLGSTLAVSASSVVASAIKIVPVLGQTAGVITLPILAGGTTYAIGEVFTRHFEVGGTLLTFDTEKVKSYYEEQLEKGKTFTEEATAKK